MFDDCKIENLYNLDETIAKDFLKKYEYPWEALKDIESFIIELGKSLDKSEYTEVKENVWIHKTANIFDSAYIKGPCIICEGAELRHSAFVRGKEKKKKNAVVGNSVELKNVILFNNVQVPHFNYVGDSILGYKAHMGAGSITSNVKSDKKLVVIKKYEIVTDKTTGEKTIKPTETFETGIKKVGAFVGDNVEVGCQSVLNPGTVIGRGSNIYPLSSVRGVIPSNSIFKSQRNIVSKN